MEAAGTTKETNEKFLLIQRAFELLSSKTERVEYDRTPNRLSNGIDTMKTCASQLSLKLKWL